MKRTATPESDDQSEVQRQLTHRAKPLLRVAEGGGNADVGGGGDRRHRDQDADERARLGGSEREDARDTGEDRDDRRELVRAWR